jgi:putative FmdB family regulatory protein
MPRYQYECGHCGEFTAWNRMSEASEPAECPVCHAMSARMVSSPFVCRMDAGLRKAHFRNEKSAHEPEVVSRQQLEKIGRPRMGHSHGRYCGHSHFHAGAARLEEDYRVHAAPDRPWLLGH